MLHYTLTIGGFIMTKRRGCTAVVVLAIILTIFVAFVEKRTARATIPPLPGSRIRAIEYFNQRPADAIGATIAKSISAPDDKFEFHAFSKTLPIGTFDKAKFESDNPDKYAYKDINRREGIETVHVFTNNPNISLAPYCHI